MTKCLKLSCNRSRSSSYHYCEFCIENRIKELQDQAIKDPGEYARWLATRTLLADEVEGEAPYRPVITDSLHSSIIDCIKRRPGQYINWDVTAKQLGRSRQEIAAAIKTMAQQGFISPEQPYVVYGIQSSSPWKAHVSEIRAQIRTVIK